MKAIWMLTVILAGQMSLTMALAGDQTARILSVVEVREKVVPAGDCAKKANSGDKHKVLGTVGGGLVGGVLGHQIGGGTGKKLATVAGAVGGALAGRKIQGNQQAKKKAAAADCQASEKVVGYDVKYELDGKVATVRTSRRPDGDTLPVKDGRPVLP